MGYLVDGCWQEVQSGPQKYRVPNLVIGLLPAPRFAAAAVPVRLSDERFLEAEIHCTILEEVRQTADGSYCLIPRLRITLQASGTDGAKRWESLPRSKAFSALKSCGSWVPSFCVGEKLR